DLRKVGKKAVDVGIDILRDAVLGHAEMHHWGRRDAHFWHRLGVRLEELEMREHRVVRWKIELADDLVALGPRLDPVELDAVRQRDLLAAGEPPEEIEVPSGTPILAVGREFQPDLL